MNEVGLRPADDGDGGRRAHRACLVRAAGAAVLARRHHARRPVHRDDHAPRAGAVDAGRGRAGHVRRVRGTRVHLGHDVHRRPPARRARRAARPRHWRVPRRRAGSALSWGRRSAACSPRSTASPRRSGSGSWGRRCSSPCCGASSTRSSTRATRCRTPPPADPAARRHHRQNTPRAGSFANRRTGCGAAPSCRPRPAAGTPRAPGRSRIAELPRWWCSPDAGAGQPGGDLPKGARVDLVEQPAAVQAGGEGPHEPGLLEQSKLPGHSRPAEPELGGDGRWPPRLHRDQGDDGPAARIRQQRDSDTIASRHASRMTSPAYLPRSRAFVVPRVANGTASLVFRRCPPGARAAARPRR